MYGFGYIGMSAAAAGCDLVEVIRTTVYSDRERRAAPHIADPFDEFWNWCGCVSSHLLDILGRARSYVKHWARPILSS